MNGYYIQLCDLGENPKFLSGLPVRHLKAVLELINENGGKEIKYVKKIRGLIARKEPIEFKQNSESLERKWGHIFRMKSKERILHILNNQIWQELLFILKYCPPDFREDYTKDLVEIAWKKFEAQKIDHEIFFNHENTI